MKIAFIVVPIVILALAASWMTPARQPQRAAEKPQPAPEKISDPGEATILRAAKEAAAAPVAAKQDAPLKPAPPARPAPAPVVPVAEKLEACLVSLELKDITLAEAGAAIGAQLGMPVVIDPALAVIKVDLSFGKVTGKTFLEFVCELTGAEWIPHGGGVLIRPKKE